MIEITTDQLLVILGTKEAELFVLRKRVAELEQDGQRQVAEFAERLATVEKQREDHDCRNYGEEELSNRGEEE